MNMNTTDKIIKIYELFMVLVLLILGIFIM